MATETITAANGAVYQQPNVVDGIFTYYDGPKPQVDDTSMLWGNNKYLITKTEPVADLRSLTKPLSEYHQLGHESMGEFYFENMLVHSNPPQKWAYISNQKPEEILFIKFYDTNALKKGDGSAKSMRAHGAFHVPGTEPLPPRRSIETKLFFIYDD